MATVFTICMNVSAFALNLLLVATIVFSRSLRKQPDSILICNLAMADFMVACCIMPFTSFSLIYDEIDPRNGIWTFVGFANFMFCIASILNLAMMSLDQCLTITCPFWYQLYRTQSMAVIMATCVWAYSGICGLPPLFGISSYTCFIPNTGPCSVDQWSGNNYSVIFTVIVTSASWGFGVIILFITNILIYLVVVKQRTAIKENMVHKENCPKRQSYLLALRPSNSVQQNLHPQVANDVNEDRGISLVPSLTRSEMGGQKSFGNEMQAISVGANMVNPVTLPTDAISLAHITNAEPLNLSDSPPALSHFSAILPNVMKAVRRSKPLRPRNAPRCTCSPSKKHVKSLLIIVVAYFISWTPFCSLLLLEIQQKAKRYLDLSLAFLWIGHMSSFINPALYFYRYNRFRQEAKALYTKIISKARVAAI